MGKKSVNNLYKPMLEHSNVEQKFHKAAKGKTERPDVAVILEPTNIQRHVKNVVEQLENTAPEGYRIRKRHGNHQDTGKSVSTRERAEK